MIEAFHSNWTKPFFNANPHKEYYIEDFEILTTILSALKWREKNGSIKMITDKVGANYYKSIGLEDIWDLGIDVSLEDINDKIDSNIFWAAGKLYALKSQKSPCVMMDTDFIVWENLGDILNNTEVSVIHKEKIVKEVYPDKEYFKFKDGYYLDKEFDWTVLPSNTAFMYISNDEFKDYYTATAIGSFGQRQILFYEPPREAILRAGYARGAGGHGKLLSGLVRDDPVQDKRGGRRVLHLHGGETDFVQPVLHR